MSENTISWLKFAELLKWRFDYLLNRELCLQIAEDARGFFQSGISWSVRFAILLRERYSYLLNNELCLVIAKYLKDFVRAESGGPANE